MGEIYLAKDTKLGREVALKVLPNEFAQDEDRLARLEREARLLASLNHPNVAAVHGLEKSGDLLYIVLELVEGPTLRERLAANRLSLQETLNYFHQIAQALEAAHEKGIVHRDLKPDNIKITPDNLVKVLDFGLAKALAKEAPEVDSSQSPTASYKGTSAGVVLGTIPYMSPEQARGKRLDKRSDIWSFGCCLYEALTGQHPFYRETGSDILAAILATEPNWAAIPKTTPRSIRALIRRCLQKETRERLHDIADARIELGEALAIHSKSTLIEAGISQKSRSGLNYALALVLSAIIGAAASWAWFRATPREGTQAVQRFEISLPPTEPLALGPGPSLAISPDGQRLAYVARRGDTTQVYMRVMESLEPTPVQGAEGGESPFFSADSSSIGFFADGKLKKLSLPGGSAITLADTPNLRGASWGSDDTIVFSPLTAAGLSSISAAGTASRNLTQLEVDGGEKSHRWSDILPENAGVVFTTLTGTGGRFDIEMLSFASGERTKLIEDGSYARYAPTGHLVFVRDDTLFAAPFDPGRREITGPEVPLIEDVAVDPLTGVAYFAFDHQGLLAYVPGGTLEPASEGIGRLLSLNRQGVGDPLGLPERAFQLPRLSPDGKQLVVTIYEEDRFRVWVSDDLDRGTMVPLPFEANNAFAIWAPDGKHVVFSSSSDVPVSYSLFRMPTDESGDAERLLKSSHPLFATSFSPDGKTLAFSELNQYWDVWLLNIGDVEPHPLLDASYNEAGAMFSPNGGWLAYVSDETGQDEVYVRAYPGPEGKRQISNDGGSEPVWARNGRELFYRHQDWLMAVGIETEPEFKVGKPKLLFPAPFAESGFHLPNFDVTRAERFIMIQSKMETAASRLIVVLNWFQDLKDRVPVEDR
jgi:serine/threonine protein kinase